MPSRVGVQLRSGGKNIARGVSPGYVSRRNEALKGRKKRLPRKSHAGQLDDSPQAFFRPFGALFPLAAYPGLTPRALFLAALRGWLLLGGRHDLTLPAHVAAPFDILGHRADDLVVPDPGLEHRSGFSGRIGGLPSSAQPYEGRFFQRNPRQGLTPSLLVTLAHFRS